MVRLNEHFVKAKKSYFFSEIFKHVHAFKAKNPDAKLIVFNVANTTLPLTPTIIKGLKKGIEKLSHVKTYTGYGEEIGSIQLREALQKFYKKRGIKLDTSEIFISDGAKPDTANIQSIFADDSVVAVQDPSYPVYVDSASFGGRKIVYMPCTEKTGFAPALPKTHVDLMYICSPNNPTGYALTKKQLKEVVDYANKNKAIIIFDAAYSGFISDKNVPRSIYEVPGAKTCSIEINSFSKLAGFTGVRLGWTIVPMSLKGKDVERGQINAIWRRRQTTMFNGASNIVQEGGIATLSDQGQKECKKLVQYYMENAKIIKKGLEKAGFKTIGGVNAPYLWLKTPDGMTSWEFFEYLLKTTHVVVPPGVGFGPAGEGYMRLHAFRQREDVVEAMKRISQLKLSS